jgi:hypothetical protein
MFQEEYSAESLRDTLDKMADGKEQLGALTGIKLATMTEDQLIATEEKQVNHRSKDQLNTLREDQLTSKKDQLTTRKKDQLTTSKTDQLSTTSLNQLTTSKKDQLTNTLQDQLTTTWKRLWRKAIAGKNVLPIKLFLHFSGTERKLKSLCFLLPVYAIPGLKPVIKHRNKAIKIN